MWAREYSDYHPEEPGGIGDRANLRMPTVGHRRSSAGTARGLRPGVMEVPIPMPTTGADYRWLNLMARVPRKGVPVVAKRIGQGIGGLLSRTALCRRRTGAGGGHCSPGSCAPASRSGRIRRCPRLTSDGAGSPVRSSSTDGREITVTARRGVVLAAGGFDHRMDMRWKFQSESLGSHLSLGAETNTGDAIVLAQEVGAAIDLMDQAWWFPAVAPLPGGAPVVMLAERSLPGSLIVDQNGDRFVNEATDYMSFGQCLLEREHSGRPVESMWIVFDQKYRNSYVFAAELFPRMRAPAVVVRRRNRAPLG